MGRGQEEGKSCLQARAVSLGDTVGLTLGLTLDAARCLHWAQEDGWAALSA